MLILLAGLLVLTSIGHTGDEAIAAFGRARGARCIAGGVGTEIVIGDG